MEGSFPTSERAIASKAAQSDRPANPGPQFYTNAHGFNVGTMINVGGNYIGTPGPEVASGDKEKTTKEKRDILLNFLKAPSFHGVYTSALEQRMAQTGSWLLELPDFQTFMGSKGVTLWCTGMPGAGKTILASIAVEHLDEITNDSAFTSLAFAFLRYSERYEWKDIITSLLVQLIKGNDVACTTFWPYYSRAEKKAAPDPPCFSESTLEKSLSDIARMLVRLYVVTDGLDEATDEVKDKLLKTLVPSGANLLILSRPLDLYAHRARRALFVSIQAQTADIEVYVREQVEECSILRTIFEGKPEKVTELCKKVTQQSDGMFLVAKLQMGVIAQLSTSIATLFRNLKSLPTEINAMYDLTLDRIRGSKFSSIALRTLAWVKHFHLQPTILQYALSFHPDTQSFDADDITPIPLILSACQGLVTVDQDEMRLVHYSTSEYLESISMDGFPDALLEAQQAMDETQNLLFLCAPDKKCKLMKASFRLFSVINCLPSALKILNVEDLPRTLQYGTLTIDFCQGQYNGQKVCLKRCTRGHLQQYEIDQHLQRQALLWANLAQAGSWRHGITPLIGVFHHGHDKAITLVSPWMDNGSLLDYLNAYPTVDRFLLIRDVFETVHYLHTIGVIHGDLRAQNFTINSSGRAWVYNFESSEMVIDDNILWEPFRGSLGAIAWRSPELFRVGLDDPIPTAKSDVYSLGCLVYEVFTGQRPFWEIRDSMQFLWLKFEKTPTKPKPDSEVYRRYGLTEEVWGMMEECWAMDPEKRPSVYDLLQRPFLKNLVDDRPLD